MVWGALRQAGIHPSGRLRIPATERARLEKQLGISTRELLRELVPFYRERAMPIVSNYNVAAVGLGRSGDVYIGVNLEFPGAQINQTVHAEQCMIANVLQEEGEVLDRIVLSAAPCGHCRQFLAELPWGPAAVVDIPDLGAEQSVAELLPHRFGPEDLGNPAPLGRHGRADWLRLQAGSGDAAAADEERLCPLSSAAVEAARTSYAPYSGCYAGVALEFAPQGGAGRPLVVAGIYIENCAFNPALPALQCALARAVCGGLAERAVLRAVIAERVDRPRAFSQEATSRGLLASIAPGADVAAVGLVAADRS